MQNNTSSNDKKYKVSALFRETLEFFKAAESWKIESMEASYVGKLDDFHRKFLDRSINKSDDMTRIPNIEDEFLRGLEKEYSGILTMFLNLKAYFIFVAALKLMNRFNTRVSRSSRENPYFIVLQRTSDGVDAIWRELGVHLPKKYKTSLRRTAKGGFPSADFKHASPEEMEIICGSVEPKLALLREQTKEIGSLRTLMAKYLLLSKKHDKQ